MHRRIRASVTVESLPTQRLPPHLVVDQWWNVRIFAAESGTNTCGELESWRAGQLELLLLHFVQLVVDNSLEVK
jgi:hypothetical protein